MGSVQKDNTKLLNFIFILNLFPFFNFVPVGSVEIEPFGAAFSFFYLVSSRKLFISRDTPVFFKGLAIFMYVMFGYFMVGVCKSIFGPWSGASYPVETFVIILAPIVVLWALSGNLHLISKKVFKWCIGLWCGLGTLQMLAPSVLNKTGIGFILTMFISRFSDASLAQIHRGVDMFAPEPSYAAYIILFMYLFTFYLNSQHRLSRKEFWILLATLAWMTILNKSGTLLMLLAITGLLAVVKMFTDVRRVHALPLAAVIIALAYYEVSHSQVRALVLVNTFLQEAVSGTLSLSSVLSVSSAYGSGRMATVVAGYTQLFSAFGLGHGLGSWAYNMSNVMQSMGFGLGANAKPYAYGSLISFDSGTVGVAILTCVLLVGILGIRSRSKFSILTFTCLGISMFGIYFDTPTSLPIFWMIYAIALEHSEKLSVQVSVRPAIHTSNNSILLAARRSG